MSDKPPSRERYERENPTVSFRISREKKEQLDELVDDLEISKKEWFEDIIGEEARDYERVREEAYEAGYQEACEEHLLEVPCAVCGRPVNLAPDQHDTLYELLEQLSVEGPFTARPPPNHSIVWELGHEKCINDN